MTLYTEMRVACNHDGCPTWETVTVRINQTTKGWDSHVSISIVELPMGWREYDSPDRQSTYLACCAAHRPNHFGYNLLRSKDPIDE